MTPENFVKAQVAAFVYAEAAHLGGYDAMLAVACVLQNRVKRGWFGGEWLKVIANASDTTALEGGPLRKVETFTPEFRRLLQEIDDIFLGTFADTFTAGGLYYMDFCYTEHGQTVRPWFQEKILRDQENHHRIAQVSMLQIFS